MKTRYLLLSLLAATLSFGAQAGDKVYKWKDASGITHFTDQPPPKGTQFDNVQMKGGTTTATADTGGTPVKDVATKPPSTGADSTQCKTAKSRLTLLESKAEITTTQDGKTVLLDKDLRAAELNVARSQVQSYCAETAASGQ